MEKSEQWVSETVPMFCALLVPWVKQDYALKCTYVFRGEFSNQ